MLELKFITYHPCLPKRLARQAPLPPSRGCEKIKGQVNNKSGFYGHEGTKARRFHEGYKIDFILLRVPSWLGVFVVKNVGKDL
jgi:hypothetical protein